MHDAREPRGTWGLMPPAEPEDTRLAATPGLPDLPDPKETHTLLFYRKSPECQISALVK